MAWKIVTEPQGRNGEDASSEADAINNGGIVYYLAEGEYSKQEVARVAFDRSNSKNPRVSFLAQCKKTADKAVAAAKLLNTDLMGNGELE